MAKITNVTRLLEDDFPEQKEWIGKLLQPYNQFVEINTSALNKSLTIADNLDQAAPTVNVTGSQEITFKSTTKNRPMGVLVSKCVTLSGTAPTAAVQPVWEYVPATNSIKISSWYGGLSSGSKYQITLFIHTV